MAEKKGEKVYANGYVAIPEKKFYQISDVLTRQDELQTEILKVLGAINEKLAGVPAEVPVRVPAVPVAPPVPWPPPEWPAPPAWPPSPEWWPPAPEAPPAIDLSTIETFMDEYLDRVRGIPVSAVDTYTGNDATYQEVVRWDVGHVWAQRYGMLREISMTSDSFANTRFRLRIANSTTTGPIAGDKTLWDDVELDAALTQPFAWNRLPYDTEVVLECRSIGPIINVRGSITGSEWRA